MNTRSNPLFWMAAIALLGYTAQVHADLITVPTSTPDILVEEVFVSYNATADTLNVIGVPTRYDLDGIAPPDYNLSSSSSLSLFANIDSTGAASSGSFKVEGSIPALSITPQTLLHGTLSDFGFSPAGNIIQFIFNIDGGALASAFGSQAFVNINTFGGFNGSWTGGFANTGFGNADIQKVVPAPGSALLALIGGLTVIGGRGCRWFRGLLAR